MYLTYEKYRELGGVLLEDAFQPLCREACAQIDYYTFGRLKQDTAYSDAVQQCCYALIGILHEKQTYTSPVSAPEKSNTFKARKFRVSIEVSSTEGEGGSIVKMSGNLNAVGDFVDGTFDTSTKTFTPAGA